MYLYSYSSIYIHIHVFIFIFIYLYSYLSIYIHIHLFIFISIYLYSYSSIYSHIHLFIFIFIYLYSHSCYIFYIQVFIFTFMLHFHTHGYVMHGSVHSYAWFIFTARENVNASLQRFTFIFSSPKTILCEFNNSRPCILVWSSCLDQPRDHLRFPDDVMPSITRILAIILHGQINGSEMSFALHYEGHRFGPPSVHIFMFIIFSVVRFSLALCVSTLTQASDKKKITCQTMALG